ncbi:hypothetical protein [Subtercola lobariae]|uniref:Uncharacterized protein n=1 Tax=Subtercola lobariae TaxID=1588641 RepID=A0A917BE10_9MICO|nr:hypothetical protein [Subtercola lobariae]GGF34084.1 hypothetical protein GCM10011399_29100 [Subtercola lobariae]
MTAEPAPPVLIVGRISRKASNVLVLTFDDGPSAAADAKALAVAEQSGGEGAGAKLGMLFGFKNGGKGIHSLTTRAGGSYRVASGGGGSTVISSGSNEVARVQRGEQSTVFDAAGAAVFVIRADPDEPRTTDAVRLRVESPAGEERGRLDVVLRSTAWALTFSRALNVPLDLSELDFMLTRTGAALKFPTLGTRLLLYSAPTPEQLDLLLAVCVDLAIGLREYARPTPIS